MATTNERGYGWRAHRHKRDALRPMVDRGDAYCTEPICTQPSRWIKPGTPWDLAHNRETGEHRGPAHATCNRSEGGRYVQRKSRPRPWHSRTW